MPALNKKILRLTLDLDFELLALTSPLRDYRLCHMLNTRMHFHFRKTEDYILNLNADGGPTYFSRYTDYWESGENELFLLANKGSEGFLLPEMSRVDYFMMIKGHVDEPDMQHILSGLNRIDDIQAVIQINPVKVKSKENLIF